ncbi:hypothetical protein INP83_07060 [Mucilaginibacter sp. 21P]|uniref:NACHT domain-containing protein n=1 Tax=Mucilaginibacter sp. 21P TaxID=2778902 RepID=UPI001C56C4FB|nr:hypothetical protein [Mucilaginibacter sp. 21P]QXV66836.1 hypothetical protein INP83_07060 [Mucilaginibacter sp. 21P]
MPENYQEINQKEFLADYEDFAIIPPAKYNFDQLPFKDLPPRRFEQLCLKYCYKNYGMERCTLYGKPGQKQFGLDILVTGEDDDYILYQCKRVNEFLGTDLADAIKVFQDEKHQEKWYAKTSEFILFSSNELIETSFVEEMERQRKALHEVGIKLNKLGSIELSELLKNEVEIVYEFFGEQWVKGFIKPEIYQPYLANLVILPEKKIYSEVRDYIPRSLTNPEKSKDSLGYRFYDAVPLTDYIKELHADNKPARVMIRSDAGLGKSKELEHLANLYSKPGRYYPVIIRLKLYQGDLEKLIGAFYEFWKSIPRSRLFLLFDGLDEVPNIHLDTFISQFNLFLQEYEAANILATVRNSFSLRSVGDGVDENSVLKPQYLKPLDQREIEKYIANRGNSSIQIKRFLDLCVDRRLSDLLSNPFYLKNLVDLYQHASLKFPDDRADAIAQIITLKMEQDRFKFPSMPSADRFLLLGKKLAVYLTLTGRNSFPESQLTELTDLNISEIRYCSLFSCEENDNTLSIYFEHNNFQEFLTAAYLSSLSWLELKQLLFHEPAFLILKPRLVNTANYLFTLMDKDSELYLNFFNTLKSHNTELLLKFEKDKIDSNTRFEIFRYLVLEGKREGINYLRGKYEVEELLAYVLHSPTILNFLFEELEDPSSSAIHRLCLLEILRDLNTSSIIRKERKYLHLLLKNIIKSQETPAVHDMAIDVMVRHLFVDDADINLCVKKCPNRNTKIVRENILKMIRIGGDGKYFDYILESADLLFRTDSNTYSQLGNDFLEIVLNLLNPITGVKWLAFAKTNIELLGILLDGLYDPSERMVIQQINLKLATLYKQTKNDVILDDYMEFVHAIHRNLSEGKWGNLALFFINTDTIERAFFELLKKEDTVLYRSSIGADLANPTIIDLLIEKVRSGVIPQDYIRLTGNFIHYFKRFDLFNYLKDQVNLLLPDFFKPVVETQVNWHELNERRTARDFELLKGKEIFLAEAAMIFKEVARLKDFEDDWFNLEYSEKAEIKKIVTNNIIFRMIERGRITGYNAFVEWIDKWNWDYYVFTQLTKFALEMKKVIPEFWSNWMQLYVTNVLLSEIDFKKSLKKLDNGGYTTTNGARQIRGLFMADFIVLPQDVLFDIPISDTSGFSQLKPSPVKKDYLFLKVIDKVEDVDAFKQRILVNLTKDFPVPIVLETHCSICNYLQIVEAIPLLIDHLRKKSTPTDVKESIVITLNMLDIDPVILVNELKELTTITAPWHWELFKPVFNEIVSGNIIWDQSECLNLIERSIQKNKNESRLKWRLIKSALKLGSKKAADQFFAFMGNTKSWSDYADVEAKDFTNVVTYDPKKLITKCISLLKESVLNKTRERPEMVERFVTQLIRQIAVQSYDLMLFSLSSYESLIVKLIAIKPELVHLRWYEKDLVSDYYIQAATFEEENTVLNMIRSIT